MKKVLTTTTTTSSGEHVIGMRQSQVFPERIRSDEPISQRLVEAAHADDRRLASELISHPSIDVNFVGTVRLKSRKTELVLNGETASDVRVEFEEFRTDVTALFLAAHNGNVTLVKDLLDAGVNVNQKLFRGYATTAAVREGHVEVLELLLNSGGAGQAACEEALLEACYFGRARPAELLMGSDHKISPHVAVHALVTASSRGFVDFVRTLIKSGVDVEANARVLLQSSKPSLHANVDCNALVAAVVSRQASVVQLLLKVGCKTDTKVRLGAWSWDTTTGEEFRVGACLAEPYGATWCAIEYFESSGIILRTLLHHISPNIPHLGRTLLHHAILCCNPSAFDVLLTCGADVEFPDEGTNFRPIHLAARFGLAEILRLLIKAGCHLNSKTRSGETALMICARHKHQESVRLLLASADLYLDEKDENGFTSVMAAAMSGHVEIFKLLINAGADFETQNNYGETAMTLAEKTQNRDAFVKILSTYTYTRCRKSSSIHRAARLGKVELVRELVDEGYDVNGFDSDGYTPLMLAARSGDEKMCEFLISRGAKCDIKNTRNETAISLARKDGGKNKAERVILDELARRMVLSGGLVKKHTKAGRGTPHVKMLKMVEGAGVLRWGKSSKKRVICRGAEVGPSSEFKWNRRMKSDAGNPGVFRVVTTENREIHFCCQGGTEMAKLWVRGIGLVTREAVFGRNSGDVF